MPKITNVQQLLARRQSLSRQWWAEVQAARKQLHAEIEKAQKAYDDEAEQHRKVFIGRARKAAGARQDADQIVTSRLITEGSPPRLRLVSELPGAGSSPAVPYMASMALRAGDRYPMDEAKELVVAECALG